MKNRFTLSLVTLTGALTVGLALLGALPAHAAAGHAARPAIGDTQTVTWTGGGDETSWGDPDNWDAGVPQNGDSVVIAPTSQTPQPSVTGMPSGSQFEDLTLTDSSLSGGDATVSGSFSWSTSQSGEDVILDSAITAEDSASISGPATMEVQEPLVFDGATDISNPGGVIEIEDSGTAITSSGTFTMEPGSTVLATVCCASQDEFVSTGTLAMPASSKGVATLEALNLDDQGSVSVGQGSRLEVTVGPVELTTGTGVSGGGTLAFDQNADVALADNFSIGSGTTVLLTGGAEFTGSGSLTGSGKFSWTGGTIAGNLSAAAAIATTISGSAQKDLTAPGDTPIQLSFAGPTTVEGSGQLAVSGGNISSAGKFTIDPGATVQAQACCASPDEFLSTGTLAVPASSKGTATLGWMNLDDQGSVSVGKGSELDVTVGPGELTAGQGVSGGGTLAFDQDADITLASNFSIGSGTTVLLTGGAEVTGTGSFTGSGSFDWTGGTIAGDLSAAATVTTTISGSSQTSFSQPGSTPIELTLAGPTTVEKSAVVEMSGVVTLLNQGTFTMQPGAKIEAQSCCADPDTVTNTGTLDVAAGTGTGAAALSELAFRNRGTVRLTSGKLSVSGLSYDQSAGSTQLAGGSLSAAETIDINGGALTGYGTVAASVLNRGTVTPSTTGGVLTISGNYQQSKTGVLSSTITGTSPGTTFGQLAVGKKATLAGTLAVSTGGGFTPKPGEAFVILKYKSHTGKFATTTGSPSYTVTYQAADAEVVYPA